ncbi:pyruvate kinase [Salsuginibacillus halophilus]|uniref:Pyruvate kinase n=1 Tax=Salsuginibacillus halophilus TaxID=517424 RepID=A0A2P8HCW6_9BACI|nr:pyruvate kinase [Salsuginibacillus halophilus]PSL44075.1 pyruvate kinase [Salsuginibacillus halophilus]
MRKTKIVSTIGPASEDKAMLKELIGAGMNVARMNFSHGDHDEHAARIHSIREAAEEMNATVGILLDTKGPEIRTRDMEDGAVSLEEGQELTVTSEDVLGNAERIAVTYDKLAYDLQPGSKILLDDGLIELEVTSIGETDVYTKVLNSGLLKNKKGVNLPKVSVSLPGITDKDAADIRFGVEQGIDFIAASFVRRAKDVLEIRELLEGEGAEDIQIIPKIENEEGLNNLEEILEVSDGLMVARGDLGVEIPAEEVPLAQKSMIQLCNREAKPVITATQMLDSMQQNPRPTRAEASDVANAIFDGSDAVMLSGETAAGDYPKEAVQTMSNIAVQTEKALNYEEMLAKRSMQSRVTITNAISQSVANTALDLGAGAVLTATESGYTARIVSKFRPQSPIIAVTSNERVVRRLSLVWGVTPLHGKKAETTDEMLDISVSESLRSGIVSHGDLVVITAGVPVGETGTTNIMKVHIIGEVAARGQGIGRKTASGKVTVANSAQEASDKMQEGRILVTKSTDKDMIDAFEKASAVITEEGGLTSHAAVVGLNLGIPVIVGVDNATSIFTDDEEITVDSARGDLYKGHASVL